jgi:hypothetical protein
MLDKIECDEAGLQASLFFWVGIDLNAATGHLNI